MERIVAFLATLWGLFLRFWLFLLIVGVLAVVIVLAGGPRPLVDGVASALARYQRAETPVPTPIPELTPAVVVTGNGSDSLNAVAVSVDLPCRSLEWWSEAVAETKDVASLISVLDRDFKLPEGNQWSNPGYRVPAGSVFWTDLFGNVSSLPVGVRAVRTQGGWGVYFTSVEYVVPSPNGGGRWLRLCGEPEVAMVTKSITVSSSAQAQSTVTVQQGSLATCLSATTMQTIASAANPVDQYNNWFESTGSQYGHGLGVGQKAQAGGLFLGTFPEMSIPGSVRRVGSSGFIWEVLAETTVPHGGRWMQLCR